MTQLTDDPRLEGLFDLALQEGVDVRPTLLRVVTDMYVLASQHTEEEEKDFVNLVPSLLEVADTRTRVAVAAALAKYPAAPKPVIQRLARDVLIVAEPILRHAACLTSEDFAAIIAERGPGHAAAIARRGPIERLGVERFTQLLREAPPLATPSGAPEPAPAETLQPPPEQSLPLIEAAHSIAPATEPPGPASTADQASELFFSAESDVRRLILTNLEALPSGAAPPAPEEAAAAVRQIEAAALAHQPHRLVWELEKALRLPSRQAQRIVDDPRGEPILVALKALGAPGSVVQRVLLFVNAEIGHSVARVHELAALYDEFTPELAMRLVPIWRESARSPASARHRPQHEPDGARDTRTLPHAAHAHTVAQPLQVSAMSRK